jgi:hypothetical protein
MKRRPLNSLAYRPSAGNKLARGAGVYFQRNARAFIPLSAKTASFSASFALPTIEPMKDDFRKPLNGIPASSDREAVLEMGRFRDETRVEHRKSG